MDKYYKNKENKLFVNPIVENHKDLIEITKEDFDNQLVINNTPSQEDLDGKAVSEAQQLLSSTDWVVAKYNDVVTVNASMSKADFLAKYADVYTQRAEARTTINELGA